MAVRKMRSDAIDLSRATASQAGTRVYGDDERGRGSTADLDQPLSWKPLLRISPQLELDRDGEAERSVRLWPAHCRSGRSESRRDGRRRSSPSHAGFKVLGITGQDGKSLGDGVDKHPRIGDRQTDVTCQDRIVPMGLESGGQTWAAQVLVDSHESVPAPARRDRGCEAGPPRAPALVQ